MHDRADVLAGDGGPEHLGPRPVDHLEPIDEPRAVEELEQHAIERQARQVPPRGIRKEKVDVWLRELAPVIPLLRAYLDGKITWAQYRPRYRAGLRRPQAQAALAEVRALARRGTVTLLCGCADPRRCHRTLLQRHLLDSAE